MTRDDVMTWLRGAWRSWTVRVSALLLVLPDAIAILQSQYDTLRPWIPDALESRVLQLLALVMLVLRVRTTVSLAERGQRPDPGSAARDHEGLQ